MKNAKPSTSYTILPKAQKQSLAIKSISQPPDKISKIPIANFLEKV